MVKKSSRAMEEPSKHPPSSPVMRRRRASHLAPVSPATNSSAVTFSCYESQYCEEEEEEEELAEYYYSPHFLDACALCRSPLGRARDIFMYRGDTPFCSEECRQEQIELDDAGREEEKAGYWRSRRLRRQRRSRHLLREPPAEPAEVQGVHAPASETAVAG